MKSRDGRQYRAMEMRIQQEPQDDKKLVEGYASTFEEPYTLFKDEDLKMEIREVVDRGAFEETDMTDVIMQYDHRGRVFARKRNNTLNVTPDDHGLFIEADLGGTEIGRQLYEEIKGGYTDRMSFGFTIAEEERTETEADGWAVYTYRIKRVGKLYDVSAVSLPANEGTAISARGLDDGVIAELKAERLARIEEARRDAERRQALIDKIEEAIK